MKKLNSTRHPPVDSESVDRKKYPIHAQDYRLLEEVGQGVSASVHRALCIPLNEVVAIKILDFERENCDLSNISREAQTMILVDHPNVLKAHCSFVNDHSLWVVMPYMAGGSCLHILKAAYPDGFEEAVIATVLREVLRGLEYLHNHGHIHRDVKAGNILIDSCGATKLGDFGVSAYLFDSGDRQRSRNTFVGTPCWMAPEVMEQLHGYDFKADIWSFGITALELAHGHAPFSKYPPMKVLLMTLQNAPPGLDYERDKKFSKSFKQMIAMCLVKDPSKRPSAHKLLRHSFFKQARSNDYIARKILEGLATLGDRIKELKMKEEDMLAQKKIPDGKKEEMSQNEYKRGISGWNFNIEDLKAQASLIQDVDDTNSDKDMGGSSNSLCSLDTVPEKQVQCLPLKEDALEKKEDDFMMNKSAPSAFPVQTMNNIKSKSNGSEDELSVPSSNHRRSVSQGWFSSYENDSRTDLTEKYELEMDEKHLEGTASPHPDVGVTAGSSPQDHPRESDKQPAHLQNNETCTGGMVWAVDDSLSETLPKAPKLAVPNSEVDDKSKVPVVQQKGRFKVTSENMELEKALPVPSLTKSHSMQVITQLPAISVPSQSDATSNILGGSIFPQLHCILQANIIQRDNVLNLMKQLSAGELSANHTSDGGCTPAPAVALERSLLEADNEREKELVQDISELGWRLICAHDELQKLKTKTGEVLKT